MAVEPRIGDPEVGHGLASVVVVADAVAQRRIGASLSDQGLEPTALVENAAALAGLPLTPLTIVVLACDVEARRGLAELRDLRGRAKQQAILVVSPPTDSGGVRLSFGAGADALVFESEIEFTLGAAVRALASGQTVVPRRFRAGLDRPNLSHRERQVLDLVRRGYTNAEIAGALYLAESTIKSHLSSIFTKFGVHSRHEAVTVFTDLGLAWSTTPPDPA